MRNKLRTLKMVALSALSGAAMLGGHPSFAQQASAQVQLKWQPAVSMTDPAGRVTRRLSIAGGSNPDVESGNPLLIRIEEGHLASYTLSQPVYRALEKSEKTLLDTTRITGAQVTVSRTNQQHRDVTVVTIRPIRRNPATGKLEKLLAYTPVSKAQAPAARNGVGGGSNATAGYGVGSGTWGRVGVTASGVYRLGVADLRRLGIDPSSINPRNLHVLGRGGEMLPETVGAAEPGVHELAIEVTGEADGRFDEGDFVLFYGEGPTTWRFKEAEGRFRHDVNLYADTIQYLVGADNAPGRRVEAASASGGPALASYQNLQVYEREAISLMKLGRRWFSETFDLANARDYAFSTPGLAAGTNACLIVSAAARSAYTDNVAGPATFVKAYVGGSNVADLRIPGVTTYPFGPNYSDSEIQGCFPASGDNIQIRLTYDKNGNDQAIAYLDYMELFTRQNLTWANKGQGMWFPELDTMQGAVVNVNGLPGSARAWSVQNSELPAALPVSNGQISLPGQEPGQVFVFTPETAPAPLIIGTVTTKNLASTEVPTMVVITAPHLMPQAETYAAYRRNFSGISVLPISTKEIYAEFSGGHQDLAALRDFLVTLYNRSPGTLKYVMLLGDCSFDYKNRVANNTNLVPIWENVDYSNPVGGTASDDFLAMLGPGKGKLNENWSVNIPDIAIGRLPVTDAPMAEAVINKIVRYESDTLGLGSWRNILGFTADNGDSFTHLNGAESAVNVSLQNGPAYIPSKFYLAAFPLVAGPGGQSSPEIRSSLQRRVRQGALVMNYTGHGNEFQWADERIFDPETIAGLDNTPRLPFFITATCEFGRLDDPNLVSSAENLVNRAAGGGIGVLSACRPVYSSQNETLNREIYRNFYYVDPTGRSLTVGECMQRTKTVVMGNYVYLLFGDPSLRIVFPRHEVLPTGMYDMEGNRIDSVKALQTVRLEGVVRRRNSSDTLDSYQGQLQVTLYDKNVPTTVREGSRSATFVQRKSIIFNGFTRVVNGHWSITFQLPLDINYTYGDGLFNFYAQPDQGLEDANGYRNLIVGGSAPASVDDTPPTVRLFMNDTTFKDGGVVGPNPTFIARLWDNTGINVSLSGIGHEMVGTFSYAAKEGVVMNNFYVSDVGKPNQGTVRFPLSDLKPGTYNVHFKAWDLQNNSAEATLTFTVRGAAEACPALARPTVSPNPVSDRAQFSFDIDRTGGELDVEVRVMDLAGRYIGSAATHYDNAPARAGQGLNFSLDQADGQTLANGTYLYHIITNGPEGCKATTRGRMVINR